MNISLAPLQGFTDATFRSAWQKHFTGIDTYYAPYITLQNDDRIKKSQWRDILPEHNAIVPIPQLLPKSVKEACVLMGALDGLGGFEEVNINMGCPYPMVTNRGRGSGLLPHPEVVKGILDALCDRYGADYRFSVKMRCGLLEHDEMEAVFDVLNAFPLSAVILHPRVAKQLYKGEASWDYFAKAELMTDLPLVYNGDINSRLDYLRLLSEFPKLTGVMLGRGVLANPALPEEIVKKMELPRDERLSRMYNFMLDLVEGNRAVLSGESHLLSKMKSYLPYIASTNLDKKKAYKKAKKARFLDIYMLELKAYLSD